MNHTPPARDVSSAVVAVVAIIALMVGLFAPLSQNPDGNYYFGTALRLSRGEFVNSIEGLYAPLLSWLMAPLIAAGISVFGAFRAVTFGAYLATLLITRALCRRGGLTPLLSALAVLLVGTHLLYFTVVLVTGDLLATPFFLGMVLLLTRSTGTGRPTSAALGLLAALGYYAKAMQLPIGLFALGIWGCIESIQSRQFAAIRLSAGAAGWTILLCLPWVLALSMLYGLPVFSGQQLQQLGKVNVMDYSPNDAATVKAASSLTQSTAAIGETFERLKPDSNRISSSFPYLYRVTVGLLFGEVGFWCYSIFLLYGLWTIVRSPNSRGLYSPLAAFFIAQTGSYAIIWASYIRYFFPALPLAHIAAVIGFEAMRTDAAALKLPRMLLLQRTLPRFVGAIGAVALFSVLLTTTRSMSGDWQGKNDTVVDEIATLAPVSQGSGIITGNGANMFAGMTAYRLKREYWASIYPDRELDAVALERKLAHWNVTQIVWVGDPFPLLGQLSCTVSSGTFMVQGNQVSVYDVDRSCTEKRIKQ